MARFIQSGNAIDYVAAANVVAGDVVVQGDLVGVVRQDALSGELTSLSTSGVFQFAKATGGAIAAGAIIYWNSATGVATTNASGAKLIGKAVAAAATDATTVLGLLSP